MRTTIVVYCSLLIAFLLLPITVSFASPEWPRIIGIGEIEQLARTTGGKYSGRVEGVTMPGSPPDGSYSEFRYRPIQVYPFHHQNIGDPHLANEAFVLFEIKNIDAKPERTTETVYYKLLHLSTENNQFALVEALNFNELPTEGRMGVEINNWLRGYYSRSMMNEYDNENRWLPGFLSSKRELLVTSYDGSDTQHMPFTYHISLKEGGAPVVREKVSFEVTQGVKNLADRYAVWDANANKWIEVVANLAINKVQPLPVNDQGEIILRLFIDFGRMRLFKLTMPATIDVTFSAEKCQPVKNQITLRHPAFIRDAFFLCANDPQWPGASRWIRLSQLNRYDQYSEDSEMVPGLNIAGTIIPPKSYRKGDICYPFPFELPKRILINRQVFDLPNWDSDFYYPLNDKDQIIIDMHQDPVVGQGKFTPRLGDGLAISVLWLDGVRGFFAQQLSKDDCFFAAQIGNGWGSTGQSSETTWTRFGISQAAQWLVTDRLVTYAVTGVATFVGGPVAGAWAATICTAGLAGKDLKELYDVGTTKHKVVIFRSTVMMEKNSQGENSLFVVEGNPGVINEQGKEIRATKGQTINFMIDGEVKPPVAGQLSLAMQRMAVALPDSTPRAQKSSHTVPEPQKSTTTADNLPATTNNKPAVSVVHTPKPVVTSSAVSPPQTVNPVTTTTSQSPPTSLEAAKERYLKAFEIYTKLVTTGGAGNVEEALKEYKESYAIYKKLKDQKNKN